MHLTQVYTISCVLYLRVASDALTPHRVNRHGLLDKPVKKLAPRLRSPAVETKGEFVQVIVQVRYTDSPLMCSQQPASEQRNNAVYHWQQVLADIRILADDLVDIAQPFQWSVPSPAVRTDNRAWGNPFLYSTPQTPCRRIGYSSEANSSDPMAILLGCDNYQCLPGRAPTTLTRLFSTKVSFVDLHNTRETIAPWPHHRIAQFVQPRPSGSVTAQAQYTLKAQRADPVFLIRQVPHRPEPQPQRSPGILKDGACRYRGLEITLHTVVQSPTSLPSLRMLTTRATKPIGPPKLEKILSASLLRDKSLLEFHQRSRVVFHTRLYYILGLLESSA